MGGFFSQPKRTASATEMPTMAASDMGAEETPGMDAGGVPTTMAATTMAPTTMAPTTMAPTTMAAPTYPSELIFVQSGQVTNGKEVYRSGPRALSLGTKDNILAQVSAILSKNNINEPFNHVTIWTDGGFRAYNVPPGTSITTTADTWNSTYSIPSESTSSTPNISFVQSGQVTNGKEVYRSRARALSLGTKDNILSQISEILSKNNINEKYNHVTIWTDGGFRAYNVPPGTSVTTTADTWNSTYSVPEISTFASISRFGASGGGMLVLLLLLLVAAVLYYLYTQGKIKIPTFEQRMASFGKAIKSLRRRR